jgi:integrase
MPLTDAACRNAKPSEKPRKLADAGNLYLLVQPTGSRLWRMNYRFGGKQKTLAFGKYPDVSLAEARLRRDNARLLLATGLDPADPKPVDAISFEEVALEWLQARIDWTPRHQSRVMTRIEADIFPQFGHIAVSKLEAPMILAALRKVEDRGSFEMAKRLRQAVGQIMRYAIATGRASRDPAADLKGAMKPSPRVRHMAALREKDLPEFMAKLAAYDGDLRTRLAIEVVMHTFVRTGELRTARWSEIEGDIWRIPADRMKMGREHVVPLTPQTLALLDQLRAEPTDGFVCKMSENTMLYAMYRMGYHSRATIHGFRSTASTILNESGLWSPDAIERQLAHVPGNVVRSAYNAAQYLPERKRMMEWWSDFLTAKQVQDRKIEPSI